MENEVVVEVHLPSPAANVEIPSEDSEPEVVIENQIESELRNENRSFHVITIDDDDEPEAMDINIEENSSNNEDCEKTELKTNNPENQQFVDSDDSDPGTQCMICYSSYDTGSHKLCCLKCGHLFGLSCIQHWLKVACPHTARKCPSCNTKASPRDIRILYAKTLLATDTSEIDRLTKHIKKIENEKMMLESTIKNSNLRIEMLQQQIFKQEAAIKQLMECSGSRKLMNGGHKSYCSKLVDGFKLSEQGECRVLAHSSHLSLLVASQSSGNPIFPGYGIRKINSYDLKIAQYVKLHDKQIRDMAFGFQEKANLLSVSTDCTAKLFDVQSNAVVQTFSVPEALWSCCWNLTDPYRIFCGGVTGTFYVFDRRHPGGEPEHVIKVPNQKTGLISLCSVPPRPGRFMPNGGVLACSLTSVIAFYQLGDTYESKVLPIDGQFLSMRYNETTDNILISAKSTTTWKAPRHLVCQLAQQYGNVRNEIDTLHTYYATRNPSVLSRSTFIPTPDGDQMICAYNDRDKTLDLWSMMNDRKLDIQNVKLPDPVLDLCSFSTNENEITIPCLSAKNLYVVKLENKS